MRTVSASDVEAKLREWATGAVQASDVQNWAEERFAVDEWEAESGSVNTVMAHLDMLDLNLVIPDDIPMLIEALRAPDAAAVIDAHAASVNYTARMASLRGVQPYARVLKHDA